MKVKTIFRPDPGSKTLIVRFEDLTEKIIFSKDIKDYEYKENSWTIAKWVETKDGKRYENSKLLRSNPKR